MKEKRVGDKTILVVRQKEAKSVLTESEREMDYRAEKAVEAAINQAKVRNKPIAKYDKKTKESYMELNGERIYAK